MTDGIRVTVTGGDEAGWIEPWIAAMRLAPPRLLTLALRISDEDPPTEDAREPYRQPHVRVRAGPPDNDVRIHWIPGRACAIIPAGSDTAHITLDRTAAADRERLAPTLLTVALVFLLRRVGWHHVHAATARDPRGRDWLFAGNAEAGKSTTAALLATRGWSVGGDDFTVLAQDGASVAAIAQAAPIALRPGGYALLGRPGGAPSRQGRKVAFTPEELGGSWASRVTPEIIVFPRVEGERTLVEPMRPAVALAELVRWSAWVALEPDMAQQHLDLIGALVRQARCFRLALGPDLFHEQRDILQELIP